MSLTMEKLSSELLQQYNELPYGDHFSTKDFRMEIDNIDIRVSVVMHMVRNKFLEIGRVSTSNLCANIANIYIDLPENKQPRKAVREHFTSQLESNSLNFGLDGKIFDSIIISFVKKNAALFPSSMKSYQITWGSDNEGRAG